MKLLPILAILSIALLACTQAPGTQTAQEGRAVFTITDAAADMGTVSEVRVVVDEVRVHSESQGWITVTSDSQEFDLLELKAQGSQALLADASLAPDTYNQMRLDISQVTVVDDRGENEAKLPSGELKLQGELVVEENSTSTATFDFIADESLHVAGNGQYMMAPVVQVTTRTDAQVDASSRSNVEISGGNIVTDVKLGMGTDGNMAVGIQIPAAANINIGSGVISIGGGSGNADANTDARVNVTGNGTNVDVGADVDAGIY